jgi:hypothetical protein
MDPVRIAVTTPSRAYAVAIENNAIDQLGTILDEVRAPERRFIVSSPLVWRLHGPRERGSRVHAHHLRRRRHRRHGGLRRGHIS